VPQHTRHIPVTFSVRHINRASDEGRTSVPQDGIPLMMEAFLSSCTPRCDRT